MVTMAPTELVVAIAESQRQESMLVAQRLADVAELLAQRTNEVEAEDPDPGFMMVTGFQRATAEVGRGVQPVSCGRQHHGFACRYFGGAAAQGGSGTRSR